MLSSVFRRVTLAAKPLRGFSGIKVDSEDTHPDFRTETKINPGSARDFIEKVID